MTESPLAGARSYLYVPGTDADRLDKAVDRGADAIVADLEDAVRLADKPAARRTVAAWLARRPTGRPQVWVRINADQVDDDISALGDPPLDGLFVPKVELDRLALVDEQLTRREVRLGRLVGEVRVIGLIETATGLLDVAAIARGPRVQRLGIGEADLSAELGIARDGGPSLATLRLGLVVASAAARIEAPIGPISTDFRDLEALAATTGDLRSQGFRARTAIHPHQLPVINAAFRPSDRELAEARRLIARLDASGSGVAVDEDGRMLDEAVVRSARATVAAAGTDQNEDGDD